MHVCEIRIYVYYIKRTWKKKEASRDCNLFYSFISSFLHSFSQTWRGYLLLASCALKYTLCVPSASHRSVITTRDSFQYLMQQPHNIFRARELSRGLSISYLNTGIKSFGAVRRGAARRGAARRGGQIVWLPSTSHRSATPAWRNR